MLKSKCSICYGHPMMTFAHISSYPHRVNLSKLPSYFWLMSDEQVFKSIHKHTRGLKSLAVE